MNIFGVDRYFLKEQSKLLQGYQYQVQGYKKRKFSEITIEEKVQIAEAVFVERQYHQDVADKFGVSKETIKNLVMNIKKDSGYLKKLNQKDIAHRIKKEQVIESTEKLVNVSNCVTSASDIK